MITTDSGKIIKDMDILQTVYPVLGTASSLKKCIINCLQSRWDAYSKYNIAVGGLLQDVTN